MSTVNAPFGFIAAKHLSGNARASAYTIASGYAANIFQGDPVKLVTAGTIQLGTSDGTRTGTVDNISILGVFAGCEYLDSTGKPVVSNFWPASTSATNITAYVYDDPATQFVVQANGSIAATAIGDQADWAEFNTSGGGSTVTGRSTGALSSTLAGAASNGQFRIIEIQRGVDNAAGDTYTKVVVQIAEHQYVAEAAAI